MSNLQEGIAATEQLLRRDNAASAVTVNKVLDNLHTLLGYAEHQPSHFTTGEQQQAALQTKNVGE